MSETMPDHEIRIALVLNGGVSLAVWMGGVTHELDLIRRASSSGDAPAAQEYDEALAARWQELCQQGGDQRRLVVDVIAGTSAGGLNGSLLATAIAHGSTLDPPGADKGPWLRQRWVSLGSLDVGKLLPAPGVPSTSVLDGDYFLDQLGNLLSGVARAGNASAAEPVTLFVTASGLGVQQFEAQDAAGQHFVVPDHRYLYSFTSEKRAQYEVATRTFPFIEDNGLADTELLARAARASASFPAAFAPVLETPRMAARPPRLVPGPREPGTEAWLVDGGVLDNAPFGPVLDVIARRPVSGKATRYVLYVVPSAGIGQAATELPETTQPSWRVTALSAVQYPREVDFRADVEQLERLLLDADASWSDTQRLFDRCVIQPEERRRLAEAAKLLQPVYSRGRAAGGVWEAATTANHEHSTVLDAAAALSESQIDEILGTNPAWVPGPDCRTDPVRMEAGGKPCWPWGPGAAERIVRLVLRSLRARIDSAEGGEGIVELETQLSATSNSLQRVQAVYDAVSGLLANADLDLRPADAAGAVAASINDIFEKLQVQQVLGEEMTTLVHFVGPEVVKTALEVEIVSRCTSARTPQQRSAPFQFLRLGPDIPLMLLDDRPEGSIANDLKDRILYGTQVGHFGAFGAADWRHWDWLMGRLHCVAHLGAMLGADAGWIRETQLLVLKAEGWELEQVADRIQRLARDFPPAAGLKALTTMRDELNTSQEGRATTQGVIDRLVAVSGGLDKRVGDWTRASAGRLEEPTTGTLRYIRWLTEPARDTLWHRVLAEVELTPAPRPLLFQSWFPLAVLAVGAGLVAIASVVPNTALAVIAAVLAGVVATAGISLLVGSWFVRRQRRRMRAWIEKKVPPIAAPKH
jgi:predicted acylesterase/phospholipase RssA